MRNLPKAYEHTYEEGIEYQDFVSDQLYDRGIPVLCHYASKQYQLKKGENKLGVEIKYDRKMKTTGNIFIEIGEKSKTGKFVKSGLYRDDNSWLYAIGDYELIFVFSKKYLKRLYESDHNRLISKDEKGRWRLKTGLFKKTPIETSDGFIISIKEAELYAEIIIRPKEKL